MFLFTSEYEKAINLYWNKFILKKEPIPDNFNEVRPEIVASWKRSLRHNVSPMDIYPPVLTREQINKILQDNATLIRISRSYIQNIYSFIKGTNFAIVLTDKNGCVVDLISDDTLINARTEKTGLRIGAIRSEPLTGTSGIATCLYLNKPFQVLGEEHFVKPHHAYICSAAPINDSDGNILGCLAMLGPREIKSAHSLGMVSAAVDGISKELKMEKAYEHISNINSQLKTTIESLSSGIVLINSQGVITQYNELALKILHLNRQTMESKTLSEIITAVTPNIDIFNVTHDIKNQELRLLSPDKDIIDLSLSASVVRNQENQAIGTLYTLSELKDVKKLVTKMGGFTARYTFNSILGNSPEITHEKGLALNAAHSDSNLLILGESGTGKELFAQSIHNASKRSKGPFVAINCGSLPKSLIESELFGYDQGAFTGANKGGHPGKFELAEGGTIFLDEIGDMPLELQASLLRVLQNKEIVRVGGKQSKNIDVRIIAATNINLTEAVQKKNFREDLYYRLNVLSIHLTPLRNRKGDIPFLLDHFIARYSTSYGKNFMLDPNARGILEQYQWPGNVRELENVVERAVNMTAGNIITKTELPAEMLNFGNMPDLSIEKKHLNEFVPDSPVYEYERIIEVLRRAHGDIPSTSAILNMPKRTLYRKIQKYNIDLKIYRKW